MRARRNLNSGQLDAHSAVPTTRYPQRAGKRSIMRAANIEPKTIGLWVVALEKRSLADSIQAEAPRPAMMLQTNIGRVNKSVTCQGSRVANSSLRAVQSIIGSSDDTMSKNKAKGKISRRKNGLPTIEKKNPAIEVKNSKLPWTFQRQSLLQLFETRFNGL